MKTPRRLASLALALALVCGVARAALPDSGMADTAPTEPCTFLPGPKAETASAPARPNENRAAPPVRRKTRPAAKRPTPPRSAEKRIPSERVSDRG